MEDKNVQPTPKRFAHYRQMSPDQKWQEVIKLRAFAWDMKCAALKQAHPDWDEGTIQNRVREIFLYATT